MLNKVVARRENLDQDRDDFGSINEKEVSKSAVIAVLGFLCSVFILSGVYEYSQFREIAAYECTPEQEAKVDAASIACTLGPGNNHSLCLTQVVKSHCSRPGPSNSALSQLGEL